MTSATPTPNTADSSFDALLRQVAHAPAPARSRAHRGTALTPSLTLVRELAEGGMGVLWEASSRALGRAVAVKLLHPRAGRYATHEAAALERLRHPRIVRMHGFGAADEGEFIVMELIDGETLAERVRRDGPLDPAATSELVTQIADALAHAHAHGILHRDIKPSNILLAGPAHGPIDARLLDFGISRELPDDRSALVIPPARAGTPGYMSPEQIDAPDTLDGRSDLWALGAVAHFALTGRRPNGACPTKPPRALAPWFDRALSPDRRRRFRTAWEMQSAFRRALVVERAPATKSLTSFLAACAAAADRPASARAAIAHDTTVRDRRRAALLLAVVIAWLLTRLW